MTTSPAQPYLSLCIGRLDGWEAPRSSKPWLVPPVPVNEADDVVADEENEELAVEQFVDAASPAQKQAGEGT